MDYPIQIHGGDGTTLWNGMGAVCNALEGINTGAAAVTVGSVISVDVTNLIMSSWAATAATALTYPQKRAVCMAHSTTYNLVLGVAVNAAPIGDRVIIAGQGSVVPVRCVGTSAAYNLVTTSTAGLALAAAAVAATSVGQVGKVVKIAGTTGGTTDSGSASYNIGLINPY